MGTSLSGLTPATTFDALIKVGDNGPLSGTAKVLSDGLGNDSVLALSTTAVGIGTSAPAELLHLSTTLGSSTGVGTAIQITSGGAGGDQAFIGVNKGAGNGLELSVENRDIIFNTGATTPFGGTERMRITSTGNVGIGTSAPATTLHVSDAASTSATFNSTFGQMAISFANSGNTFAQLGSGVSVTGTGLATDLGLGTNGQASASIVFATGVGFTERFRVTNNGVTFNGDTAAANALDDYEEGTWTPTDASGAGLTFTTSEGSYTKIGREVFYRAFIQYPSTVDVSISIIGGLPFTVPNSQTARGGNVTYSDETTLVYALSNLNSTSVSLYNNAGLSLTNATMSTNVLFISGNYCV